MIKSTVGEYSMGRHVTIGIKHMTREQYNAYYREVNRRKRERDREDNPPAPEPAHKICTRCNIEYLMTEEFFYKNKRGLNKYFSSWCKSCTKDYNSTRPRPGTHEGNCDICWKKGKMFTIYDPSASYILGAMCGGCRLMMNAAGNRPDLLRRAAEYLEERS
jgi:hypothetical protein